MRRGRLLSAMSIPFGFVVGHVVAYAVVPPVHKEAAVAAHGYFESLAGSAVPLGLFAILAAVVHGRRRDPLGLRWSTVCAQLVAVYLLVEFAEHAAIGVSLEDIVTEPNLLVGVVVQFAIGIGLYFLLRTAHEFGESTNTVGFLTVRRAMVQMFAVDQVLVPALSPSEVHLRGPPRN